MTKFGTTIYNQGDIILVPFPFTDQKGNKVRPALVVSNNTYNQTSTDLILCAITTNTLSNNHTILIDNKSTSKGYLHEQSAIKVDAILRIQKTLIIKTIATLKKPILLKTISTIQKLFTPSLHQQGNTQ